MGIFSFFKKVFNKPEVERIVSHLPPRHTDDFFAIALMKKHFPKAVLEFLSPQKVPPMYLEDPKVALIDIGRRYEVEKLNFDHHQDRSLNSSLVLVMDFLGYKKEKESKIVQIIDYVDRFGLDDARRRFKFDTPQDVQQKLKIVLKVDLDKYFNEVADTFLKVIKQTEDINEFWRKLYDELFKLRVLIEAEKEWKKEVLQEIKKLVKIYTINGLKIGYATIPVGKYNKILFQDLKLDLLIERNYKNKFQTTFVKNRANPNIYLTKVFNLYPKRFIDADGIVAIVDEPIENIDVKTVAKAVYVRKR